MMAAVLLPLLLSSPVLRAQDAPSARPRFVFSAIANEQTHAMAKAVLTAAYHKLGATIDFMDLPGLRALEWANSGRTDGDVARISGTEGKFPHLVPVPVPVAHFVGVTFTKHFTGDIRRWEDLKGARIGVIRGIRYSTIGTRGMSPLFASDMTHLFTLLEHGRIDVAVAVQNAGTIEISRHFKGHGIHQIGAPLHSDDLYHFLNDKHRDLTDAVARVLQEMTDSGEIAAIHRQTLHALMEAP